MDRSNLHQYQERCISFIKDKQKCALFLDMGMGKTTSTLTSMSDLLVEGKVKRILIIAPLRVANSVWKQESRKWKHLNHLDIEIATGGQKNRKEAMDKNSAIVVINRDVIHSLVHEYGKKWPFDMIVIDESSSFKSSSTLRFRSIKKILKSVQYMGLLTGTPSPNGLGDLWSQFFLIDQGESLGRTKGSFYEAFFTQDYMGYSYTLNDGAETKIYERIKNRSMRMDSKDYLELPDRIDLDVGIELPPAVMKQYKELEKEFVMVLNTNTTIDVINSAVLAGKLLQICNGAIYHGEDSGYTILHDKKIEELKQILEDNPEDNFLVAYNFRSDLERLKKAFPEAVILDTNEKTITRWNNKEIRLLLAHPASAGHGLNLQNGGHQIVWFGLNWSLELYQQFNARLNRQGQSHPVVITHLVVKKGMDEKIMKALSEKHDTQKALLDYLKAEM